MGLETYRKLYAAVAARPPLICLLRAANAVGVLLMAGIYGALLLALWLKPDPLRISAVVIPLTGLVLVSLLRRVIDAPRPYALLGVTPPMPHRGDGQSFPSRHLFSCAVITMIVLRSWPLWGVLLLLVTLLMAVIRVVGGVHWLRDVTFGVLLGVLSGALGFFYL